MRKNMTYPGLFLIFLAFLFPVLTQGQEYVGLYQESVAKTLLAKGIMIEAFSKVDDPNQKGFFIQYRRVLRIEKAVINPDKNNSWYYVHFGPVIPHDGSYVFWKSGDRAPWLTGTKPPQGPSKWTTVHEHLDCDKKESFCQRYDNYPVSFSALIQGKVTATTRDASFSLDGTLHGTVYEFTYGWGKGTFNFSPDFTSFTGFFSDDNGHKGRWWGTID